MDKLIVDSVALTSFRSWNSGLFEFQPGVTLVTGTNGSGKSTIGMAVQYAINGKLPKLTKDDLKQRGSNAPMKVKVTCQRNGETLSVERGAKLIVRQGKNSVSVRESSFMADLQRSVDYSFLSQNMSSFVDMPEYKRRELLDSLIPEVTVLRSIAAPAVKNISKRYYERKYNFNNNIQYVMDSIADMENSIKSAQNAYNDSVRRFQEILEQQKKSLPFSDETYQQYKVELSELVKSRKEMERYKNDLSVWLMNVQKANRDIAEQERLTDYMIAEQKKIEAKIAGLEQSKQNTDMTCPSCKVNLVCSNCGAQVKDGAASGAIDRAIEVEQKSWQDIDAKLKENAETDTPASMQTPLEEIQAQTANLNKATNDINAINARTETLRNAIATYEQQLKAIETARSVVLNKEALATMQKHIKDLEQRREELKATVERKKHVYDVMTETEESLTQAADVLYSVLPTMYFDQFLRRLTYACNYLLESISNMKIEMSANADGISIYVNGSKLAQLSSGELQRVRVAVTLSFSLLAVRTDTLFLDEMFDTALDEDGMAALAILLRGPIMKFYNKVVVITHKAELMAALNPDRIVRVFKDKNGVSQTEITK